MVKQVFHQSTAVGNLMIDDEITGIAGKPLSQHRFGMFYGTKCDVGYEDPIMGFGNAIDGPNPHFSHCD